MDGDGGVAAGGGNHHQQGQEQEVRIEAGDDRQWETIHDAAREGDLEEVQRLLRIYYPTRRLLRDEEVWGTTPLAKAAMNGHFQVADYLISAGSDINFRERDTGKTVFYYACQGGCVKLVKHLVQYHVEYHLMARQHPYIDEFLHTPLMEAAYRGHVEVCDHLTKLYGHRALDFQREDGHTALFIATRKEKWKVMEILLRAGADFDIPSFMMCMGGPGGPMPWFTPRQIAQALELDTSHRILDHTERFFELSKARTTVDLARAIQKRIPEVEEMTDVEAWVDFAKLAPQCLEKRVSTGDFNFDEQGHLMLYDDDDNYHSEEKGSNRSEKKKKEKERLKATVELVVNDLSQEIFVKLAAMLVNISL